MNWFHYFMSIFAGCLYLGLLISALVLWTRQQPTPLLKRWLWFLIIIVFSILGPIAYLAFGREPKQA
jgi:hypothetical protein